MSNYSIQNNWAGKDALADSDPNKVISGDLFDVEFTAVQTALNSKADLNGSATQQFSATTAVAGTTTTQVATTAFVAAAISAATPTAAEVNAHAYPVGSIYTSISPTNPATLLGVGTWVAFGAGRTLIGVDTSQSEFDTVQETGGSKTHTLTENELPSHDHISPMSNGAGYSPPFGTSSISSSAIRHWDDVQSVTSAPNTSDTGGDAAHNNLQPYITVYFWKRTA
jgi:microcystin-dependent protein